MRQLSITPSITVTIGRHTRQYFAFVTTAPADLDTPGTVTLHAGALADLARFVADPFMHDIRETSISARLVLVDAMELAWQRSKCRGQEHRLLRTDANLVSFNTLQHWLWRRVQAPASTPLTA